MNNIIIVRIHIFSKRDDDDAQKVHCTTLARRLHSQLSIEPPAGSVGGTPAGYIYIIYELTVTTVCAYSVYTESNKARVLNHVVAEKVQIDMDRTRLTV